ncbi:hypothetical protein SAMN05660479_01167 [Microbulbifer thermotolerans]|nr:hypothetical protein SAMN05660479_01167 [Microbulbifer thermotolerans]
MPLESNKYWVDDGPLFVVNRNPLVTYRVIDQEELGLYGSENTAYDFITSSFSNPRGVFEESFFNSHKEYDLLHKEKNGLDFYILSKENESKAYVVAKSIDNCLEISVFGANAHSVLSDIIDKARLTNGE